MLLEEGGADTGPPEQQPEHHSSGPASAVAALTLHARMLAPAELFPRRIGAGHVRAVCELAPRHAHARGMQRRRLVGWPPLKAELVHEVQRVEGRPDLHVVVE